MNLLAFAVEAVGGGLVASALFDVSAALGRRTPRPRGGPGPATPTSWSPLTRVAVRYDASRGGRRLAAVLDAASIRMSPARWRAAQAAAATAAAAVAAVAGMPPTWGLSVAALTVRVGGRLWLRARRETRDEELVDAAGVLARHLATELASGSAADEACAALADAEEARCRPRLAALLRATLARAAVGEPVALALHRAVGGLPPGRGREALALLATELELVVARGCGTAVLTRLASGIEGRRQTVAEVRAATAEVRMATLAVPLMAAAVAALLVLSDPAVLAAATSAAGFVVGLVLGGLAVSAVALARRVTSPWDAA